MSNKLRILVVIASLLMLSACSSAAAGPVAGTSTPEPSTKAAELSASGAYHPLTVDAFAEILAKNKRDYTIVDVHIPYEGEIEGTDLKIPYNDVNALTAALPNKDARIVLYCRSGRMSEIASRALIDKGYTQVFDVQGGMSAWEASGRTLIEK